MKDRASSDCIVAALFSGCSGSGKSTVAKYVAQQLNGEELIIDCSETNVSDIFIDNNPNASDEKKVLNKFNKKTKTIVFDKLDKSSQMNELVSKLIDAIDCGKIIINNKKTIDLKKVVLIFIVNQDVLSKNKNLTPELLKLHDRLSEERILRFEKEKLNDISEIEEMIEADSFGHQFKNEESIIKKLILDISVLNYYNDNILNENFDARVLKNQIHEKTKAFIAPLIEKYNEEYSKYLSSDSRIVKLCLVRAIQPTFPSNHLDEPVKKTIFKSVSIKIICKDNKILCTYDKDENK